jgi:hypothetical protein
MRFLLLAPVALLTLSLVTAACGGGGGEATPTAQAGDPGQVGANEKPTPTAPPMQKPAVLPDEAMAVEITGTEFYGPTVKELKGLMTTSITVNGKTYKGITLTALAERVKAPAGVVMTIQGYRADFARVIFHRSELAANGATTVLYMDNEGYFNIASSTIPGAEWTKAVLSITFP